MIKRIALRALSSPPIYPLLHRRFRKDGAVTILCYHTLGPDKGGPDGWTMLRMGDFKAQIAFLRQHYDIVGLDAALTPAAKGARPRAVLTFDDGDVGLFTCLLPFVAAEELPVTLYIATGQLETGHPYWFDRLVNELQGPMRIDLTADGLPVWDLPAASGKDRWAVLGDILETLKAAGPDIRPALVDAVLSQAGQGGAPQPEPALGPLSLDQLRALAASPYVTIGAHSHCHNLLDQIPLDEARTSVALSRRRLQDWTGQKVRHFAYPNGNHNAALRKMVADLGFVTATALGMAQAMPGTDHFAWPRFPIGRYDGIERFRLRLAGI